ncbi:3-hydroxybutyryl-CoA dehydrogenase [Actinomadura sp. NBRC 104412]|uniref:3-hydroxyacyl-CoA dehydrogenase family protein n=1 Tax=Actinomadura sp. NBRC 104412 TaxID=3032203 RepID=UPI0024A3568E|nr:3-hydroxyacyl-CoA dehydrogenase family protein [Actinomadura sp. NBRC 104412]GLZ07507.1 3-hydroxybutyryl-CoA dehydrogenase [Actinomadura sp. NBRC 104412]
MEPVIDPAAITTVGVLGAGTMGSGIATVVARAGLEVILIDNDDGALARGLEKVRAFLDRSVSLGKLPSRTRDAALRSLRGTTDLGLLADADVVVEAIVEDTAAKAGAFGALDDVCRPSTLFHTNTSTLPVTAIAAGSKHPRRVVGTHYCNPAPLMSLVEVAAGRRTAPEAVAASEAFLRRVGKTTVRTKDTPGFIVNRFLIPFENDCIRALEAGLGTVESIDLAVTGALRHPMGPFTLLDIVGLDIHRAVSLRLYEQLRDPRFAPPPLVEAMISAGTLGRKTGRGFYGYSDDRAFGA